jgi:hypothetical protein
MIANFKRWLIVFTLLLGPFDSFSQIKKFRTYQKGFQLSLFPGTSTNGIESGFYYNKYSVNIFGGLSAGNHILEVGLITNVNLVSSTGIQIAGFANIIGANSFYNLTLSEERQLIHDDFESNMKGIQLAGLLNYVRNHTSGIQLSGGLNVIGGNFKGFQFAGIGNSSAGTSSGVMLAGIYNVVYESVAGFQLSSIFNFTDFELAGLQVALINKARMIRGRKTTPPVPSRGMQIGLINFCKETDGVQIGLINFGGATRGKQFGLINFFQRTSSKEYVRMGTPIGLLNFGSKGSYFRLYYNELFTTNIEYTTGNCLNCSWIMGSEMPYHDMNKIYNQNALILGYDHVDKTWGFGYGFQKKLYNKASTRPNPANEKRMMSYGIKVMHLNKSLRLDKNFNMVTRLNFDYGKRIRSLYWFAGLSLNYFLYHEDADSDLYHVQSMTLAAGKLFDLQSLFWPGYEIGIQL